jgi:hypothetical protein
MMTYDMRYLSTVGLIGHATIAGGTQAVRRVTRMKLHPCPRIVEQKFIGRDCTAQLPLA